MHGHWLDNIRRLFPCFSDIADHHWTSSEIIRVTPDTPHAIREGHVLQHAIFHDQRIDPRLQVESIRQRDNDIPLVRITFPSYRRHGSGTCNCKRICGGSSRRHFGAK